MWDERSNKVLPDQWVPLRKLGYEPPPSYRACSTDLPRSHASLPSLLVEMVDVVPYSIFLSYGQADA